MCFAGVRGYALGNLWFFPGFPSNDRSQWYYIGFNFVFDIFEEEVRVGGKKRIGGTSVISVIGVIGAICGIGEGHFFRLCHL